MMNRVHSIVSGIERQQLRLLAERQLRSERAARQTMLVLGAGTLFNLLLIAVIAFLVRRDLQQGRAIARAHPEKQAVSIEEAVHGSE